MPLTSAALANEINTDPQTYGYSTHVATGNDQAIADLLNKPRDGTDGEAAISVKRADCTPEEIMEAIDVRDFPASPTNVSNLTLAGSYLESVMQFPRIRLLSDAAGKTLIRKNIDRLVADTNGSQARLDAVAVRIGSRAEQLFGTGVRVTSSDVAKALRG
jgi:hypothetical protein